MDKIVSCDGGLPWRFTDKAMSAWGGLRLLEEMLRRIGFARALAQAGLPQPGSNRGLDPVTVLRFLRFCGQGLLEIERKSPYAIQQH